MIRASEPSGVHVAIGLSKGPYLANAAFHTGNKAVFILLTGWWFQIYFIFTPTWGNDPN